MKSVVTIGLNLGKSVFKYTALMEEGRLSSSGG